jgi:hypothetical protein
MNELIGCSRCGGFLGADSAVCPHCGTRPSARRRGRWAAFLGLAGSASLGLTMMACYGGPPTTCEPDEGCGGDPDAGGMTDGGPDGGAAN